MTTSTHPTVLRRLTRARQVLTAAVGAASDAEQSASLGAGHESDTVGGVDRVRGFLALALEDYAQVLAELRPGGPAGGLADKAITRDVVKEMGR